MLNTVILVGGLAKDPEVMKTEGEVSVTNITLVIDRPYRDSIVIMFSERILFLSLFAGDMLMM